MEARFFRLMVFLSITGFVASLSYSGYCYYKEIDLSGYVPKLYQDTRYFSEECKNNGPESFACGAVKDARTRFDTTSAIRFEYRDKKEDAVKLAFIIPFFSIFTFFSLQWIITGKPVRFRRKSRG